MDPANQPTLSPPRPSPGTLQRLIPTGETGRTLDGHPLRFEELARQRWKGALFVRAQCFCDPTPFAAR
ncbi:hypothetical protein [Inhella crocodyli]|uniref:Uncharacterized protein n=1 Tax=Inhella crocodyli TaxID=2499851 RepID=A0A3S2UBN5_9BURK|nr:hypothetical protein [Inhella crocodyli]RVT83708.1 hypothetical protein EOD73_14120 [Inhella crocodyli]